MLLDLLERRFAIRKYTDQPVSLESLESVIRAACR